MPMASSGGAALRPLPRLALPRRSPTCLRPLTHVCTRRQPGRSCGLGGRHRRRGVRHGGERVVCMRTHTPLPAFTAANQLTRPTLCPRALAVPPRGRRPVEPRSAVQPHIRSHQHLCEPRSCPSCPLCNACDPCLPRLCCPCSRPAAPPSCAAAPHPHCCQLVPFLLQSWEADASPELKAAVKEQFGDFEAFKANVTATAGLRGWVLALPPLEARARGSRDHA